MKKIIGIFIFMLLIGTLIISVGGRTTVLSNEKSKNNIISNNLQSGNTDLKFMIAGESLRCLRSYWLHVPPSYNGSEAVPLVIVLHGGTDFILKNPLWFFRSSWMDNYTGFSAKADEEGFIVVYPNAKLLLQVPAYGFDPEYSPAWIYKFIDDVGFIHDLIDKMEQEYTINSSRIYVAGFSIGGVMSYSLGAYLSDTFAAIAPVAATIGYRGSEDDPFYYIPTPTNPVSVIAFHGTNDSSDIPYNGSLFSISVNESISFWVEHNGCNHIPEINTSASGKIIRRTYTNWKNGTEVLLYTTVGGDHWWPGNHWNFALSAPWWLSDTIQEISATDLIWDFFEAHPKQ